MAKVDFIVAPTTPRNFTVKEVEAQPVKLNSALGSYTNFMNLLDYSALALPAGRYQGKLPWGVTIFADAWMDRALLELGGKYERVLSRNVPAVSADGFDEILVVVCGAHHGSWRASRFRRENPALLPDVSRPGRCRLTGKASTRPGG
jgi:allophanate hydrolase